VGLYPTSSPATVAHIASHAPFDLFCVEDEKELMRLLGGRPLEEVMPTVKRVILLAPHARPESATHGERVMTWDDFIRIGRSESDSGLDAVERVQFANEAAMLVYTSGTTGVPKG